MLTETEFQNLISKKESSILDFKKDLYDFENDENLITTAKFVKDVISFCNTIRTEKSYIVFGIKDHNNEPNEIIGINKNIDDAILQDKIKDKVAPRPIFHYYTIDSNNLKFGIIEFPVYKYEMPISCNRQMRGLIKEKVYFRNSSSNTEANLLDTIRISDWLKSLPQNNNENTLNEQISEMLTKLTDRSISLSGIFADLLSISKKNNLEKLSAFCLSQINGIKSNEEKDHQYRTQKVLLSNIKIDIPNQFALTAENVKKEIEKDSRFLEFKLLLHQPIIELEQHLDKIEEKKNSVIITIQSNSSQFMKSEKDFPVYLYIFPDNIINLYRNIRQKAIELLTDTF